jgi:hypothetical protein
MNCSLNILYFVLGEANPYLLRATKALAIIYPVLYIGVWV